MELFTPVNKDCRGYTNSFKCNSCGALIYTAEYSKEIDFNYCPYCADADEETTIRANGIVNRLKITVSKAIKIKKNAFNSNKYINGLSLDYLADMLGIDRETGEYKED